jgi:hypothetical protein
MFITLLYIVIYLYIVHILLNNNKKHKIVRNGGICLASEKEEKRRVRKTQDQILCEKNDHEKILVAE